MQLDRVVIGMDFSPAAIEAARWTARHFARGAELVLVHSIFIPEPPRFLRGRFPSTGALIETAQVGADKRLREVSNSLGADRVWLEIRVGRAADQIARIADEYKADLVVVGKHGERPGIWGRLGSTAEHVVRSSAVPVLLATGVRNSPPSNLLVPVDDADATPWVLGWAHFLAQRFDAEATALHVVSSAVLSHVLSMAAITTGGAELGPEQVQEEFRLEADRWIEQLLRTGLARERVRSEVAFGEPGQEILAAAERLGSDLIIMGSRGAGRVRRALMGSVVGEVLRGSTCPVLIVGEPQEAITE